ncbi:MAG: ATP-binding protein [Carboxylicivirga sp.]|jgi:signal transduction histidine kinase/ligand-binding sensor domain-containing protein/AraC-like DNA-binding protein|nr:ATP-binding protein [Carboxylicivirga sp.]
MNLPITKYYKYKILLFLLCIIGHITVSGELQFRHYNSNDGLNNNTVFSIIQDGDGFMWFGTEKGLARFDGITFRHYYFKYDSNDGIPGNRIDQLETDYNGCVWLLWEGKLAKYNKVNDEFDAIEASYFSNSEVFVNYIFNGENGLLGICTNKGVWLYNYKEEKFEQQLELNERLILNDIGVAVYTEGLGYMILDNNAIYTLESLTSQSEKMILEYGEVVPNLRDGLRAISKGFDEEIIISAHSGIYTINKIELTIKPLMLPNTKALMSSSMVHCIECDIDGRIWIGTELGINVYNPDTKKLEVYQQNLKDKNALQDNAIYSIYKDKHHNMWVGTFFSGVSVNLRYGNSFTHYKAGENEKSLNGKAISQIVEDEIGNLWIASEDGGLSYFDIKTQSFQNFSDEGVKSLSYRNVHALAFDKRNRLWIGTYLGGLNILDDGIFRSQSYEQNKPWNLPSNDVYSLCMDKNGTIWVGTTAGLSYFDKTTGNLTRPEGDANSGWCMSIINGNDSTIWVGMWGRGLFRSSVDNKSFKSVSGYINDSNTPIPKNIISLEQTNDNLIWIGTTDNGLYSFDPATNKFRHIETLSTIPDNTIYSIIAEDNNRIWITTNNGLVLYNRTKENYKLYNVSDGLPINQFNYKSGLMHSNGNIYLGTVDGMVSFNPDRIVENTNVSEIKIVELTLFNKPIKPSLGKSVLQTAVFDTKEIRLKHNENSLGFKFALFDYTSPENNSYAYRMRGLNEKWQEVGNQNQANYAHIPHGAYVFEVKGCNNDGVWSENVASIAIQIEPPFWLSWKGYLVYLFILTSMIWGYWRYSRIRLAQHTELERVKLDKEKVEEVNKLKLKFFTNISHEFRTPLSLIIDPLQKVAEMKFRDKQLQETIHLILRNAKRLQVLVNQLLDFRKTETGQFTLSVEDSDIIDCINNVFIRFKPLANQQEIDFTFTQGSFPGKVWFDRKVVDIILNNLISNAFKFTPNGGQIEVVAKMIVSDITYVEITISDTGIGIAPKHLKRIFERFYQVENEESMRLGSGLGLALVQSLVDLHHGGITVRSKLRQGSSFSFRFPITKSSYKQEELHKTSFKQNNEAVTEVKQSGTEVEDSVIEKKSVKILLVEDNEELRSYIVQELNTLYLIEGVENGRIAWDKIKNDPPDIIVSDVMMPEMDGFELCKIIKNEIRTSHIPVILLTAKSGVDNQIDGLEYGADIYIEKPFNSKILKAHIYNLIQLKSMLIKRFTTEIGIEVSELTRSNKDKDFLKQAIQIVFKNLSDTDFGSNDLVQEMGLSRSLLYMKLKEVTGKSVGEFIQSIRIKEAARLLKANQLTISEIAYQTGFNDPAYFSRCFKKNFGISPKEYKSSIP